MSPIFRLRATLADAEAHRAHGEEGVRLRFRPERTRRVEEAIEHFAPLAPEQSVRAVAGRADVARLLRLGRVAPPRDPAALAGSVERVAELLLRARGREVLLTVRPRLRVRFRAWTDEGVTTIEDVEEVREEPDSYTVKRRGHRLPLRIPRARVVRHATETETWYQVLSIDRPPAPQT